MGILGLAGQKLWASRKPASSVAGYTAGRAKSTGEAGLDQAINIAVGRIDVAQIIKYTFLFVILCAVVIFLIQTARGFNIAFSQMACGATHLFGGGELCDPNRINTEIPMSIITSFWEVEWFWRCLFYLGCAFITGLLIYKFAVFLMNKLLTVDREIKKLDKWIFGFGWEGTAEEEFRTRI
jgi:hypothetical protein